MIVLLAQTAFVIAGICATIRLLRGPELTDRIAALDVVLLVVMSGVAVDAAGRGEGVNLTLITVIAVVGFTATVAVGRFVEATAGDDHDGTS